MILNTLDSFRCRTMRCYIRSGHASPVKANINNKLKLDIIYTYYSSKERAVNGILPLSQQKQASISPLSQSFCPHLWSIFSISITTRTTQEHNDGTWVGLKCRKLCIDCIVWGIWSVTSNILHMLGLQNLNYISSLSAALGVLKCD